MKGFSGWKFSTYPGLLRGSLFLLLFVIVPGAARCQVSHIDSLLAFDLGAAISQHVGNKPFTIASESSLQALIRAIPHSTGGSSVIEITGVSAMVDLRDVKDSKDSRSDQLFVNARGTIISPGNSLAQPWAVSRAFNISLTARDRLLLETNQDRYVSLERAAPKSFWASTLEPALVVIGAAVIVALFFLIRS